MRLAERAFNITTKAISGLIGIVSPYRAARYEYARTIYRQFSQRGYNAALRKGSDSGWHPMNKSADSEMRMDATRVLARARDLARNNEYISGAIETKVANILGPGISPQPIAKRKGGSVNKQFNDAAKDLFERWAFIAGFYDVQEMALRHFMEDGEVIVKLNMADDGITSGVPPLRLQPLECDQLAEYLDGVTINGNIIKRGVELDQFHRVVAYHVLDYHPGEAYGWLGTMNPYTARRIPADQLIHVFKRKRLSQTRGISPLAAIIPRMYDLGEYQDYEMVGAKLGAAFTIFRKTNFPDVYQPDAISGATAGDNVSKLEYIEPGRIERLPPGEEIQVAENKRPGTNYDPFIRSNLRGASVGYGLSYESFSGDYTSSTWTSARTALLEERRKYRKEQQLLCDQFNNPVYRRFIEQAVLFGMLPAPGFSTDRLLYETVKWHCPGWEWVDPQKEASASETELAIGLTTRQKILATRGEEFEDVLNQLAKEYDLAEKAGVDIFPSAKRETITETAAAGMPTEAAPTPEPAKPNGKGNGAAIPTQKEGA